MKINNNKLYIAITCGDKIPRKIKKHVFGRRVSKAKLKRLLKSVEIIKSANTIYELPEIKPYAFCPNCGCTEMTGTGNKSCYPEHWEYFNCLRCNYVVAYIDNSPFIHALECENYDPVF